MKIGTAGVAVGHSTGVIKYNPSIECRAMTIRGGLVGLALWGYKALAEYNAADARSQMTALEARIGQLKAIQLGKCR